MNPPNRPEDRAEHSCCPGLTDVTVRVARLEQDVHEMRTDLRADIKALNDKLDRFASRSTAWGLTTLAGIAASLLYIVLNHGLMK